LLCALVRSALNNHTIVITPPLWCILRRLRAHHSFIASPVPRTIARGTWNFVSEVIALLFLATATATATAVAVAVAVAVARIAATTLLLARKGDRPIGIRDRVTVHVGGRGFSQKH
jgi:hypothetical protein